MLTNDQIDALAAGPEADAAVAEAMGKTVLGIYPCDCIFDGSWSPCDAGEEGDEPRVVILERCICHLFDGKPSREPKKPHGHYHGCIDIAPGYSTDPGAAMGLLNELRFVEWTRCDGNNHQVGIGIDNDCGEVYGCANTFALAAVRAFLLYKSRATRKGEG